MRAIAIIAFGFAMFASSVSNSELVPWRVFAAKNKVVRWVGREVLASNPYKYRDHVIAFQAWFVGSIADTAIVANEFADLNQALSIRMMSSNLPQKGDPVVVAVRVWGPDSEHAEDNLSLVDIYRCSKTDCAEFGQFDGFGALMLADVQPRPPLVRRTSDQPMATVRPMEGN